MSNKTDKFAGHNLLPAEVMKKWVADICAAHPDKDVFLFVFDKIPDNIAPSDKINAVSQVETSVDRYDWIKVGNLGVMLATEGNDRMEASGLLHACEKMGLSIDDIKKRANESELESD